MSSRIMGNILESLKSITAPRNRLMMALAAEGALFQIAMSTKGFGNNLFATNLGATDTQISLIQTVGCAVTLLMLLPVGIIADRCKSSKTVPFVMLLLGSLTFIGQALVPWMGDARIIMFFLFIGLSSGTTGSYSSQWQTMFGDMVPPERRNHTYALRNRVMVALGMLVPMLCGIAMTGETDPESKLRVLSAFMFISGLFMLVQAFVIMRMPGGQRSPESISENDAFSLKNVGVAISAAIKNRPLMAYVLVSMLLYTSWHMDWSMFYIGQIQYVGLTEAQLSYLNAINCFVQIFMLGFMARLNQKKSPHFTICINTLALVTSPLVMIATFNLPAGPVRQWGFIVFYLLSCMWECGIGMCMVQMLLEVVPVKHRALTISLYTILTTLSNCIMPFAGVRLYTALGADINAFRYFMYICVSYRALVVAFMVVRYKRLKKKGLLVTYQ